MKYTIYKTTNKINNKIYVGIHKTSNPYDSYLGSGVALMDAIKIYGKHSFSKEVLHICKNKKEAIQMEADIVNEDFVKRRDTYNLTVGGDLPPDFSREKRSRIKKEFYKNNPEARKAVGDRMRAFWNSPEGRKKRPETTPDQIKKMQDGRIKAKECPKHREMLFKKQSEAMKKRFENPKENEQSKKALIAVSRRGMNEDTLKKRIKVEELLKSGKYNFWGGTNKLAKECDVSYDFVRRARNLLLKIGEM